VEEAAGEGRPGQHSLGHVHDRCQQELVVAAEPARPRGGYHCRFRVYLSRRGKVPPGRPGCPRGRRTRLNALQGMAQRRSPRALPRGLVC
jgi:hypothetical protein